MESIEEEAEKDVKEFDIKLSEILIWNYHGEVPMETLIDVESLEKIVDSITNYDG